MNICFAVNENYAIYLCVALSSILKNAAMDDIFHFWVFNPDLSETTKAELLKLKKIHDFLIDFILIDAENELPDFPIWKTYNSKLAHYRFKIPMIMSEYGENRCLYLDADIIVNDSLSNLYKTNLRGKAVGLVPSPWGEEEKKVIPLLHLSENHKYAYSGLMLVDVNEYVKQDIYGKASAIAKTKGENLYWPDMDILNLTLNGNNYCELPPTYSINPGFKGFEGKTVFLKAYENIFDKDTVLKALNNPIIYQLAGPAKPFSKRSLPHIKQAFFEYTCGTIWKKQAKKWLPKSLLWKIKYFISSIEKRREEKKGFVILKMLHDKPDVYIKQFIVKNKEDKNLYVLAISHSELTKWKIANATSTEVIQKLCSVYGKFYKFNMPIRTFVDENGNICAIWKYFKKLKTKSYQDNYFQTAVEHAKEVFKCSADFVITQQNVDAFAYHSLKNSIYMQKSDLDKMLSYQRYKELLLKEKFIKVAPQHCDYALENIMFDKSNNVWLMDLERSCSRHIASYDWYHITRKKNGWTKPLKNVNIPYYELCNAYCNVLKEWSDNFNA